MATTLGSLIPLLDSADAPDRQTLIDLRMRHYACAWLIESKAGVNAAPQKLNVPEATVPPGTLPLPR